MGTPEKSFHSAFNGGLPLKHAPPKRRPVNREKERVQESKREQERERAKEGERDEAREQRASRKITDRCKSSGTKVHRFRCSYPVRSSGNLSRRSCLPRTATPHRRRNAPPRLFSFFFFYSDSRHRSIDRSEKKKNTRKEQINEENLKLVKSRRRMFTLSLFLCISAFFRACSRRIPAFSRRRSRVARRNDSSTSFAKEKKVKVTKKATFRRNDRRTGNANSVFAGLRAR